MGRVLSAPPDLAALIDAYYAAPDAPGKVRAHYDLIRWPHWAKRTTYTHAGVRVALVWGSLKIEDHNHKNTSQKGS
jgi:hypothetical protein